MVTWLFNNVKYHKLLSAAGKIEESPFFEIMHFWTNKPDFNSMFTETAKWLKLRDMNNQFQDNGFTGEARSPGADLKSVRGRCKNNLVTYIRSIIPCFIFVMYEFPMKIRIIITGLILWSLLFQTLPAQEFLSRDSLLRQLKFAGQDTSRVWLYISIGQQFENNDPDSAMYYYQQARDLSERLDYKLGLIKYISNVTYLYNSQGKYDTALSLNLQSVELAREYGTPVQLAACLGNVANSYL